MRTASRPGAWLFSLLKRGGNPLKQGRKRATPALDAVAGLQRLEPRLLMHGHIDDDSAPLVEAGEVIVAEPYEAAAPKSGDIVYRRTKHGWEVAAPHDADPTHVNGPSHYLKDPRNGSLYRWKDHNTSTAGIVDIFYDFRSEAGYTNLLTSAGRTIAEAALDMWERATGGKLNFVRNTTASNRDIINIGIGDLAAVGYGGSAYLGISLNSLNPTDGYSITYSTAWLNKNYSWDTTIGNGAVSGAYDLFTSVAHEIGHSLGLGHTDDLAGKDIMDGTYPGEMTAPSTYDNQHIRTLYGYNSSGTTTTTPPPTTTTTTTTTSSGPIRISPTSGLVTSESGATAQFSVVLASKPTSNVTLTLGSLNTDEGTVNKSSLTFTPTNWSTAQVVTVTGVNDARIDGDKAYTIILRRASSMDRAFDDFDAPDVTVVNRDNDGGTATTTTTTTTTSSGAIRVSPTSGLYTSESGATAQFSVVLASKPTSNVTITLGSLNTDEGTVNKSSLTFTPTNWSTAQVVTVTGVNDARIDGDKAYTIILRRASSMDRAFDDFDAPDVTVVNRDNDGGMGQTAEAAPTKPSRANGRHAEVEHTHPGQARSSSPLQAPGGIIDLLAPSMKKWRGIF